MAEECGAMDMLYDCLPQRFKDDINAIKKLNEGNIGDVKSQNLPRYTSFIRYCKRRKRLALEKKEMLQK